MDRQGRPHGGPRIASGAPPEGSEPERSAATPRGQEAFAVALAPADGAAIARQAPRTTLVLGEEDWMNVSKHVVNGTALAVAAASRPALAHRHRTADEARTASSSRTRLAARRLPPRAWTRARASVGSRWASRTGRRRGIIGAEACAKAAPDGYTLCYETDHGVNPLSLPDDGLTWTRLHPIIPPARWQLVMSHPSLALAHAAAHRAEGQPDAIPYALTTYHLAYFVYQGLKVTNGASSCRCLQGATGAAGLLAARFRWPLCARAAQPT